MNERPTLNAQRPTPKFPVSSFKLRTSHLGAAAALAAALVAGAAAGAPLRRPAAEVVVPITGDVIDLAIFPQPRQEAASGQALLVEAVSVEAAGLEASPARRLLDAQLTAWGIEQAEAAPARIVLRLVEAPERWRPAPEQGYRLTVATQGEGVAITIDGGGSAGVYYGVQTLRQLVHIKDGLVYAREVAIEDWPAVPFRGPASVEAARWKMNLRQEELPWPPSDPEAKNRQANVQRQAGIRKQLAVIDADAEKQRRTAENPLDDIASVLDDGPAADTEQRIREHGRQARARLEQEMRGLQAQIVTLDAAYERHKESVLAALRERIARERAHHIEPVIHYKADHLWGQFVAHAEHVETLTQKAIACFEAGYACGARRFSMNFDLSTGYQPQSPDAPTYGEIQARVANRIWARLKELDPQNQLYLEHQKNAVRIQPNRNHISGYTIRRSLDELAAEFAAAGPPEDVQIMWIGCGETVPRITADHARTISDLFGGRRASFLNIQELRGRFLIHDLDIFANGVGSFIGNGAMERHDPALAGHLDLANLPGWGNSQWGWNPEGYDERRVTAGMLREWLRGVGGPAAYAELAALAQWQRENGAYAVIGMGWTLEAMLGEDQNRLTPEQVDERMARKQAFYDARLHALRAALPAAGDKLYQRIEKEVRERLAYLNEHVAPAVKAKPVGKAVRAAGPVRLDGILDEAAWAGAPEHGGFKGLRTERDGGGKRAWVTVTLETSFRAVYDDTHLYIAVQCREPDLGRVAADPGSAITSVVGGDHVQLVIDPSGLKRRATHLTTTIHGQRIVGNEGHWSGARTDPGPLLEWQWPRTFDVKTGKAADHWVAEFSIALADLEPQYRPAPGRRWGFNVLRRRSLRGGDPKSEFFENRFSWQQTANQAEERHGGPSYRGQILYCGALVFE